jgi:hypothetical protein
MYKESRLQKNSSFKRERESQVEELRFRSNPMIYLFWQVEESGLVTFLLVDHGKYGGKRD